MLFLFFCCDYKYKALIQVKESCLKVPSVLELSKVSPLLYPCPSIYSVTLRAGILDVHSCWWAWADVIWPGSVGSALLWLEDGWSVEWTGSCLEVSWTGCSWFGGKEGDWFGVGWFGGMEGD